MCSPIINKSLNAEEERFRGKIHFDGKHIREVLNILKGCLDKMSGERVERFFLFLNEQHVLVQLGLNRDCYII
jgi:hypothetical protein